MSFARRAWKSSLPGLRVGLGLLALSALLAACASPPVVLSPTPTGAMLPEAQAIEMGLKICASGRIASSGEPRLDVAELTGNQAIADRLGRSTWIDLPPDSPVWLVKFSGAFTIAQPPTQGGAAPTALGPFPSCWAIIEARTGARGAVYIPEK